MKRSAYGLELSLASIQEVLLNIENSRKGNAPLMLGKEFVQP